MGAYARTRRHSFYFPLNGSYYFWAWGDWWAPGGVSSSISRVCHDIVGNYTGANSLDSTHSITQRGYMDGMYYDNSGPGGAPFLRYGARGCPVGYNPSAPPLDSGHLVPSSQEQSDLAIKSMAATNPSRATVSMPTFVAELKDLPELVLDWGRRLIRLRRTRQLFNLPWAQNLLAKGYSETYITYRWVVAPMVSDMTKMLKFHEETVKRFALLKRLQTKRIIRGRTSGSESGNTVTSAAFAYASQPGAFVTATQTVVYSRKTWGSCSWTISSSGSNATNLPSNDKELFELSGRLVRGMTSFGAVETAWELLPWSWFTDWMADVGSVLQAANNVVHANPGQFCTMCTRKASASYSVVSQPSWLSVKTGTEETTNKWRIPVAGPSSPFISPSFVSLLEARHFAILASLAVLRAR